MEDETENLYVAARRAQGLPDEPSDEVIARLVDCFRPVRSNPEAMTPSERTMRARLAAHTMHARNDSRVTSKPGRDAFLARFEREVDPEGVLSPEERARRAEHAKKAHMSALAYKSAASRRARGGRR